MAETLTINGVSAEQVYETVRDAGIGDADAKILVSNWIYQNYLTLSRSFSYGTAFPASVPDCVPTPFARTFVHKDWVDGEDLVQAGQSADDNGFNMRLHQIEHDLDSLGAKLATAVDCMADMRASLRKMFDEIASELNRIDNDIAGTVKGPTVVGPSVGGYLPGYYGGYQYGPQVGINVGPGVNPPNFTGPMPPGTEGDPLLNYLGTTIYQDKAVSLFNTSKGVVILPAVDVSTPANVDRRVTSAGAVARAITENRQLGQAVRQGVDKNVLVERFGGLELSNGQTLQQALSVLPANAKYESPTQFLNDLSGRMASALQSTTGLSRQLAAAVSAPAGVSDMASVDISGMKELPPAATSALRKAGVSTIGQFAKLTAGSISQILGKTNVGLNAGEIAAIHGTAQTLSHMQIE
ncbi:hypothetical protein [Fimbriimonas ginsengisoli]|uniref:Uncharacterized protein n=1 Tax=Fimbriimonas ginsengisoli Gsoil 348 TaxID=661478 RepID=A0A068NSU5_FIMGI|nr:hypothetical protein [Fimbriimonas ginsengisoli]AIE86501.1 hypothetical protein OP10G_3133 [Fimbriimonas ginsengisoli Gsoil 348]